MNIQQLLLSLAVGEEQSFDVFQIYCFYILVGSFRDSDLDPVEKQLATQSFFLTNQFVPKMVNVDVSFSGNNPCKCLVPD